MGAWSGLAWCRRLGISARDLPILDGGRRRRFRGRYGEDRCRTSRHRRRPLVGRLSGGDRGWFRIDRWLPGKVILESLEQTYEIAALVLALPVLEIIVAAATAGIDETAGPDKHIICRDDIGNRGLARIVAGEPYIYRDIVRDCAKDDRKEAVHTEQQLGATIVKSVDVRLGPEGGEAGEGVVNVCKDPVPAGVELDILAQPGLGQRLLRAHEIGRAHV